MDFSPLTMIKYGEDKGDFPLSTSNKVKIPSWTSFAASFQVFLTTCTNILGIGRRELSTENVLNVCRHGGLNPSVQKLPDLRTRTRTKDGPRSCSAPTSGWALGHRWTLPTLQTLRTTITKRLNEVVSTKQDSSSYNYMLKINLINLY